MIVHVDQTTAVATALGKCATAVDAVTPGRWAFTLANGTALAASAGLDDGWLLLDAPLDGVAAGSPAWDLLRWNATLDGGARFALHPGRPRLHARAEIPLDEEVDLPRRVLDACAGLKGANERLLCGPDGAHGADGATASVDGHGHGRPLADLCRESTWAFVEREGGRLAVDLDVPEAFQQALVEPRGSGVAVTVPVTETTGDPAPAACRQATGILLLRVCGVVRMARAVAAAEDGPAPARFEVVFGSRPCAAELGHAFAALSVACRIASREASVLWHDEPIARAYVEQWERRKENEHGAGSNDDTGAAGE